MDILRKRPVVIGIGTALGMAVAANLAKGDQNKPPKGSPQVLQAMVLSTASSAASGPLQITNTVTAG